MLRPQSRSSELLPHFLTTTPACRGKNCGLGIRETSPEYSRKSSGPRLSFQQLLQSQADLDQLCAVAAGRAPCTSVLLP